MDITLSKDKLNSNRFINGETVNYAIAYIISFFILIFTKQLLKIFFGVDKEAAVAVGFILGEAVLLILERFFVFKKKINTYPPRQIVLGILNAFMHFGLFRLLYAALVESLKLHDYTVWLFCAILIFIINYPLARILIFACPETPNDMKNGRIYKFVYANRFIIGAAVVSFIAMNFMFIVFKVFPFGDTTVYRMDLYHQYGPLFTELYDRVTNGGSLLYSWTSGGGSSFLGNFFNYLSSPLSSFILLFDREQMPFAVSFLVSLKCALASMTFAVYLKKSLSRHSFACAAFGVLYSFSAYMLAYFWNIMWLDGMLILPLIVLGIEKIINSGKCGLYVVSLVYSFIASYYISFMLCIFSVLYFLTYYFSAARPKKINGDLVISKRFSFKAIWNNAFINRGLKFAFSSILAAALCAVFLIPVYFILSSCSATSDDFPSQFSSYFTVLDFLQSHFAGLETTIRSSGDDVLPNVYCGVITLLLVPLFVLNKKIKMREKAAYIALLLVLLLSFNTNYLNFIWHAFHFPNDLPYRFSFVYSFILLVISFKSLAHLKYLGIKEIGLTAFLWIGFLAISQEMPTNKISDFTIYATIAFVIVWTAFLFLAKKGRAGRLVLGTLILAISFCEIIICDTNSFGFNQSLSDYNSNYNAYTDAVEELNKNDDSFYRAELCYLNTRMDPCIYGYNGISTFSSMAYEDYSRLQYNLGMYGNRINSYTYNTQTPVYNAMHGIKYLIYNGTNARPSTDLYTRFYENTEDGVTVYKNDYTLPIAYGVNSAVEVWNTAEGNPFEVQSDFFSLATGISGVFKEAQYYSYKYTGLSGDPITENSTVFFKKDDSGYACVDITLKAVTDGNLYLYVTSQDLRSITCDYGDNSITQYIETPYILDLGYFSKGSEVTVNAECGSLDNEQGSFTIYSYCLDKEAFEQGFETLKNNSLNVTDHSDTRIAGNIVCDRDCVLYSSIPYDEGWSVYIDGEKTDIIKIGNAMLGANIGKGEHTVEYVYRPRGILLGACITGSALLGIIAFYLVGKRKRKNELNAKSSTFLYG